MSNFYFSFFFFIIIIFFILSQKFIFILKPHYLITNKNRIGLSSKQRKLLDVSLNENLIVEQWLPPLLYSSSSSSSNLSENIKIIRLRFDLELIKIKHAELNEDLVIEKINELLDQQVFMVGQFVILDIAGIPVQLTIRSFQNLNEEPCLIPSSSSYSNSKNSERKTNYNMGIFTSEEALIEINPIGLTKTFKFIKSTKSNSSNSQLRLIQNLDFTQLGIGGLNEEFNQIFRRAFASRLFAPKLVKALGVKHMKGLLLYGPPATGKTLIVRQIGKLLNDGAVEPKVCNGPEIMNKYVGESAKNILLFQDAKEDYKKNADDAKLHIIIFDEIDAIAKARGRGGDTIGAEDSVVTTVLIEMDGLGSSPNVLVIAMTNKPEILDPALKRPGRFEVHVEISLPDVSGRLEILNIHTSQMRENNLLDSTINFQFLAEQTKNYSGQN